MGAPLGNSNAKKGYDATRALELMIKYFDEHGDGEIDWPNVKVASGMKPLMRMWEHQVRDAMFNGNKGALTMIVERIEGKPRQALDLGGQEDNPIESKSTFNFLPVGNGD